MALCRENVLHVKHLLYSFYHLISISFDFFLLSSQVFNQCSLFSLDIFFLSLSGCQCWVYLGHIKINSKEMGTQISIGFTNSYSQQPESFLYIICLPNLTSLVFVLLKSTLLVFIGVLTALIAEICEGVKLHTLMCFEHMCQTSLAHRCKYKSG